jgi:hypothetical protein
MLMKLLATDGQCVADLSTDDLKDDILVVKAAS